MRLLVCGDRFWPEEDREYLFAVLDAFHVAHKVTLLIEGCAPGGDWMAGAHPPRQIEGPWDRRPTLPGWAWERGVPGDHYPAQWKRDGKKAGPIRNRQMAKEGNPQYVLAFHRNPQSSKGTYDMMTVATKMQVPALWVPFIAAPPAWARGVPNA